MEEAVTLLDFLDAARLRDELLALKKALPESENA
jgi:excinuclease UvrABC nuclease subunit